MKAIVAHEYGGPEVLKVATQQAETHHTRGKVVLQIADEPTKP